eukprot:4506047-Amphidinium_carterae.1
MSNTRKWALTVQRDVQSTFKYAAVDFKDVSRTSPGVNNKPLASSTFEAESSGCSVSLKQLVGDKLGEKPAWPTCNAQSLVCQASDWCAISSCLANPSLLSHAWQSLLVQPGLLVRSCKEKSYCFSLGPVGMHGVALWPATSAKIGGVVMTFPDLNIDGNDLRLVTVFDAMDWLVQPVLWKGPLQLEKWRNTRSASQAALTLVCAESKGSERTLFEHAVTESWYRLPLSVLKKVASHFGVALSTSAD